MSDIFKKVTSIEPDDEAALQALRVSPAEGARARDIPPKPQKSPIFHPIDEADPVPEFITRDATPIERPTVSKEPITQAALPPPPSEPAIPQPQHEAYETDAIVAYASDTSSTTWMTWVGIIAVISWIAASFAYIYAYFNLDQKWSDMSFIQFAGLILSVLLPALLIGLLFYTMRQLVKFSRQANNLNRTALALTQPDESVISKTAIMSQAIKGEIDSVDARIDKALARMIALEKVITTQSESISAVTEVTSLTTDQIASRLSTQRTAMENIAGTFDERMAMLTSTLTEQSGKLETATQQAEQKIQEARISIDGAAEKINAASEVVRGNTIEAASTLTKSHEEIEGLAEMVRSRSSELDDVYRKHALDLTGMISQLRDEQQDLSISLEERLVKMRDMSLSAKVSAESLTEASESGRKTVEALAEATRLTDTAVKQRFTEMEEMVKFSGEKAESITDRATRRVQDSLAHTRKEIARIENDMAALQMRLSAPQIEQPLELDEPAQPKPKKRKRIQLMPLEDDFPPVEADIEPESTEPLVLRPAPKATLENIRTDADVDQDFSISVIEEDMSVEFLEADLAVPDPDAEIKTFVPDITSAVETVRPTAPEKKSMFGKKAKKEKTGWHWRDMLGGLERPDDTNAIDELTKPETEEAQPVDTQTSDNTGQHMIDALTTLGLSPAAIVDDGCIIEAANTRKSKGAIPMSQAVAKRMGDPVRHLHRAMEGNPALKTDVRAYVAQYQARMEVIEHDREAIRTKLESDTGRAFLLCDAALNG